jgi:hypothetical protein
VAVEISHFGVVKVGKVVVIAVNNDGSCIDSASMEPVGRFSTNNLGEPKGQKADTSHQKRD